jgi:hypothetical protein
MLGAEPRDSRSPPINTIVFQTVELTNISKITSLPRHLERNIMDGIRSLAQTAFDTEQRFFDPPPGVDCHYDAVELCVFSDSTNVPKRIIGRGGDEQQAEQKLLFLRKVRNEELCAWLF